MDTWRLATIDVGTNTVLLLIVEVGANGFFRSLEDHAEITRLGEDVQKHGVIGAGGQQRTLEVLQRYHKRCQEMHVQEMIVAGTSALREAANATDFTTLLKKNLGLNLRVLSTREEAWYTYLSVQKGISGLSEEVLVVDIGGGSTEFVWGKRGGLHRWLSYPMGTVKLTERFLLSDPTREDECNQLIYAVDRDLSEQLAGWPTENTFGSMVGIAGTFTTLSAVEKALEPYRGEEVHGSVLSREEVIRQIRLYQSISIAERKKILGLEPQRADVILAGALLIDRIMAHFQMNRTIVSDQGIRYGLLFERISKAHP